MTPVSRRRMLAGVALAPLAGTPRMAVAATPTPPPIRPRSDWADGHPPRGPLPAEEDPRFLLIHHTVTSNTYAEADVPRQLRAIHAFHTGAERGWPDVAYNFFVDRFGTIWEGREGSIAGPVRGDASGGSQGFAQLCCFLGDFDAEPPPPAAMSAMAALLAWLAARDGIDLGVPVTFTSRGSNRWRRGVEVTTDPIAGHRDMSLTGCPGDALYPLVRSQLAPAAQALLSAAATPTDAPTPTSSPTATPSPEATPSPRASASPTPARGAGGQSPNDGRALWVGVGLAGTAAAAFAARTVRDRRRASAAEQADGQRETAADQRGGQTDEETAQGQ